ncbi:MAG: hypothetical protein QG629_298 [Patescibacteria group bacterium]|nr:hypothetical protein [Candidatus Saccharibacteria bacterium]MDQ5963216.1 hypothetical protein [Patescibacteria group bacterium]
MTPRKLYYILVAVLFLSGLGLLFVGHFANKILTSKATTLSRLKAEAENQNQLQVSLSRNKRELRKYDELNKIALAIVPQEKDQAATISEINRLASQSGIPKLSSITFPASSLGGASATTSTVSSNRLSQVTPVKGLSGVYLLPITVTLNSSDPVSYDQFISFLRKLEQNRRTAQVSSVTIQPNQSDPNKLSFTVIINKYVKL